MFKALDVNGDHKISKSEMMLSITQKMMTDRQERMYQCFTALDTNGDGFITPDEMAAALEKSNLGNDFAFLGDPASIIAAADTDKDGKVNLSEFYASLDPPAHKDEAKIAQAIEEAGADVKQIQGSGDDDQKEIGAIEIT